MEFVASHDGYRAPFGAIHTRRLVLAEGGTALKGEDEITLSSLSTTLPAILRFHLHPGVKPSRSREGAGILLSLPSGEVWSFEAGGLPLSTEESILFGTANGRARTEQIDPDRGAPHHQAR